jgi:tetratricopeptide (TPR) repeat protein
MKKSRIIILGIITVTVVFLIYNKDTPLEKAAKHMRRGDVLFAQGEYKKARLEYKNAAKIRPTDVEVEYRWGLVDEAEGDARNAFLAFIQVEQQDPSFYKARLKIANYYLIGDNTEEAQKRVDAVLAGNPENAEAHAINAAILLRKKEFVETEKEARLALDKEPNNITAISVLTGLYLARNDKDKAIAILDEGIKLNPKDISLLMLKAKIYESPLNIEKINETYQAIFKLKPQDSQLRLYLANTYVNARKIDEAEVVLRNAIDDIPNDWDIKREFINFLAKNRSLEAVEKEISIYTKKYPQNDGLYLWLSDIYVENNKIEKAVNLLEKVIAKETTDKNSLNAKTSLANINFIKGNKEIAQKMVETVLKKAPNNQQALFIRAAIATDRGDYQNAVSDLRRIIHNQPQAKDAINLLSEVFVMQGYNDLAIETLNQLIDIEPTNSPALVRLAQLYNVNGDSKHALKILDDVNKNNPKYAIAWENTARVAISIKDFETAKIAIKNLDAIEGQHITATFLEGQIASENGNGKEAFSYYTRVIDENPSSPLAEHALFALVEANRNSDRLEEITKYIASLKTNSPYVSTILGECYIKLGEINLATGAFDEAIANNSPNQSPYLYRAKIHLNEKKYDEAITILKTATEKIPSDIRASMMQADILRILKKYRESIALYDNILKNNPKIYEAANNMAAIIADHEYSNPDMLKKAQQAAEQLANSDNYLFLDTLGWVYYRQEKFEQALKMLESSIKLNPNASQEIHYHYGAILWKKGDITKAKKELSHATKEGADYPDLESAKKILKEINTSK